MSVSIKLNIYWEHSALERVTGNLEPWERVYAPFTTMLHAAASKQLSTRGYCHKVNILSN